MKAKAVVENLLERFSSSSGRTVEGNALLLAWARWGLGIVLLWRNFFIARDAAYFFQPTPWLGMEANWFALAAWGHVVLAGMLAIGLATRPVALLLCLCIIPFSMANGTYNLTPMILMPMLAGIFLLRGGAVWSVDAAIRTALGKRDALELPSMRAWQSVGLTLFLFCAVLHFAAVQFHLKDADWRHGNTLELMLTNSYLCRFYAWFRAWEAASPGTLHAVSILGVLTQTIFQVAMIPLVFFRWGRVFVIAYGAVFSVMSLVLLQISVLPWVELVLWTWLFLPSGWLPTQWVEAAMRSVRNVSIEPYPLLTRVFVLAYTMAMVVFVTSSLKANYTRTPMPQWLTIGILNRLGLLAPDVFNRTDLSMGDYWPMIYRNTDGHPVLLPLNGADGDRLDWHTSDLLYYANSLQWRRGMLGMNDIGTFLGPDAPGHKHIAALVRYDYRRSGLRDEATYTVVVFSTKASRTDCPPGERYTPHRVYQYSLVVNGDEMRRLSNEPIVLRH